MTGTPAEPKDVTFATAVLPDGQGGYVPCPELLTEAEAIRYLRLDMIGHKKPSNTIRYYRARRKLRATRIGKGLFYTRRELDRFLDLMTTAEDD